MQDKQACNVPVLTSDTAVMAVIGDPIRHSKSPLMHNAALAACEWNGVYTAFHVLPERLGEAIAGMRALGIRGMNVTIPHKEHVIPFLDEIDDHARMIGAVNTIVNDKGRLIGYNTIEAAALIDGMPQVDPEQVDVIINTTSLGMHPHVDDMSIQASYIMPHMIISDIIYNPLETKLLAAAQAAGARTHSGLGMFVYQGAIAFELWTGKEAPVNVMREAVLHAMQEVK